MKTRTTQTTSHWGGYDVTTDESAQIVRSLPLQRDPRPAPFDCGLAEIVRSDLRIDQSYVRAGFLRHGKSREHRGRDEFVAVTWDHAFSLVEQESRG